MPRHWGLKLIVMFQIRSKSYYEQGVRLVWCDLKLHKVMRPGRRFSVQDAMFAPTCGLLLRRRS